MLKLLYLLFLILLGCSPGAPPFGARDPNQLLLPPPPPPRPKITVLFLGQSNCHNAHSVGPVSPPAGSHVVHNGTELFAYPLLFGPQADLVEQLSLDGYDVLVLSKCVNGRAMNALLDDSIPKLADDVVTFRALYPDFPEPSFVVLVHGEADAADPQLAAAYARKLSGPMPEGSLSFLDAVELSWPGSTVLITEVRTRNDTLYPFHTWTRAAQHEAGILPGVCVIPTGGYEWDDDCVLRGSTNPHYAQAGLACLAARIHTAITSVSLGSGCP